MATVQHIPLLKHDLRDVLQDSAALTVYVSWESYVTCNEASVAAVARACEALPQLQPLVLDKVAAVDPARRFNNARLVLPTGAFQRDIKAVVYTPFWFECRMGEHIFAPKGRLNEDDILRWLTSVTSTMCTVHRQYCTLAGAWQVAMTDDGAQLRAIKSSKAAMNNMTLSTVSAVALTSDTDFDAWIYLDWAALEAHPDNLSVAFCDAVKAADRLHSGELQIPHSGKRRERLYAQWQSYQRGCYRDLERVVATMVAIVRNRRVSATEIAWMLREDGAGLKADLRPLFSHLHSSIANACNAVAEYVIAFVRWTRKTEKWEAERTEVDCWHVRQFPVLVEQLKSVFVYRHRSKQGQASASWSLTAETLIIKMQHDDETRMEKLAAQGRRAAQQRLHARAERLKRYLTTDAQSLRMMEVNKIMRKLSRKWTKQTQHAIKFASFKRWSTEAMCSWCEAAITNFEKTEIRLALQLWRGIVGPNPYRVDRVRTLFSTLSAVQSEVLQTFVAVAREAKAKESELEEKEGVVQLSTSGAPDAGEEFTDDEETPVSDHGSHREDWMKLLTIPRQCRQAFVDTVVICLKKMVKRFRTLPVILLQGVQSAEAQMTNRIVTSLLTGDRRLAQQANFAAHILSQTSFIHEVGNEVGKAAQIPSVRWRNLCRLVIAEALYEACIHEKPQRDAAMNFCAARIQAFFRGVLDRNRIQNIWRQADEILASELALSQHVAAEKSQSASSDNGDADTSASTDDIRRQSNSEGSSGAFVGAVLLEEKQLAPSRAVRVSLQTTRWTAKSNAIGIFVAFNARGLKTSEIPLVHRKLRARAILLTTEQSYSERPDTVVLSMSPATTATSLGAKALRVPSGVIMNEDIATMAELGLHIKGLKAGKSYAVQLCLAPQLVETLTASVQQVCGRTSHVEIDSSLTRLELSGCRTLTHVVPMTIQLQFEESPASHPHALVMGTERSVARCSISWEDWLPNEACTFTVHRAQQFPDQDVFLSVWQLVFEGTHTCCDDVISTSVLETAQSRTTLVAYRVTADKKDQPAIQEVIDLSQALAKQGDQQQLTRRGVRVIESTQASERSATEQAQAAERSDESQEADLDSMLMSLMEATPLTQFAGELRRQMA